MNDKHIDQILDDLADQSVPEVDPKIKQQAMKMALDEFDSEIESVIESETRSEINVKSSQGIENSSRPIGEESSIGWFSSISKPIRSLIMSLTTNPQAGPIFATVAIAFVAVSTVFLMPSMRTSSKLENPATQITDVPSGNTVIVDQLEPFQATEGDATVSSIESNAEVRGEVSRIEPIGEVRPFEDKDTSARDDSSVDVGGKNEQIISAPTFQADIAAEPALEEIIAMAAKSKSQPQQAEHESVVVTATKRSQEQYKKSKLAKADQTGSRARTADQLVSMSMPATAPEPTVAPPRADNKEEYAEYQANPVHLVSEDPVSTFSIDVDTASYSLVRNQLNSGYLPKPQAVRAEELINYFDYNYALPSSSKMPFEPTLSVFDSPWNAGKKLVHIGIKGYDIQAKDAPNSNLVFLLDVSGSMNSANKLPLVKQSIDLLLESLKPTDTVSIVVYAGAAGVVLEPTEVKQRSKILEAVQRLSAGGSTAGGAGIELAYQLAEQNFDKNAVNRIVLATDGDFNVGMKSNEDLKTLVERKREKGVYLSVLGFGRNNYQDDMMQTLAQNGNGVAAYIDSLSEAKKVLVDEATSALFPIAKDVKIQVEFNPATVSEYRLVGYETRHLNREDFNNDKVDAGDIGAGHTVTAIYEITPAGSENKSVDQPRYADNEPKLSRNDSTNEYGFVKIRYKLPSSTKSKLIERAIPVQNSGLEPRGSDTQFSIAVAGFAQLLTGGKNISDYDYDSVINAAILHKGQDPFGYRSEFIQLVRMAKIAKP